MKIKAIIFDMDGLLIDSEPVWNSVRVKMAHKKNVEWTVDDHRNVMGTNTEEWTSYMIERLNLAISPDEILEQTMRAMEELYADRIPFISGAVDLIYWANQNYRTAIASGSPRRLIDVVLADPALANMFDLTLATDEVGKGKPDPAIYLEAAKRLGVTPEACVVLEDSGNGVLAAVGAGMYTINVPDPRFPPSPSKVKLAQKVCPNLHEALLHLKALAA